MTDESGNLRLPQEIERYVASLEKIYRHQKQDFLQSILVNSNFSIEQTYYDGWDGGRYGFTLRLRIPEAIFVKAIKNKDEYEKQIEQDINRLFATDKEYIESASIEMELITDEDWREKSGLVLKPQKHVPDSALERIWKSRYIRAFLSHKATYKIEASKFKDELEKYGVSCFVAHADIEPTKEWMLEIENALFSMDVLVALMTEDFHDSDWTDQEIGVAVGRHILIIPVKIGKDPYGFIGKYQALTGSWENVSKMADDVFGIIAKNPSSKTKARRSAINAFKGSVFYDTSKFVVTHVLPKFEELEEAEIDEVISAFNTNDQIYDCFSVQNRLPGLLNNWTGNQYQIAEKKLIKVVPPARNVADDEVPF